MNKQRKVVITTTYNEMGIIIDTKVEEVAQPNLQPTCNQLATDTISRAAAIDALDKCHCGGKDENGRPWIYKENAVEAIEMVEPSPSAEPKRGKWIEDKGQQTLMQNFIERGEVWRVCSVCGAGHMIGHKYAIDKAYHDRHHNFCPNCGAKMEEEE